MIQYRALNSKDQREIDEIQKLVALYISEPYSIYVFHFFLTQWPNMCILAIDEGIIVGVVIGKLEPHRNVRSRGYIGILVVDKPYRRKGIAHLLVEKVVMEMVEHGADEIMLETEVVNKTASKLYKNMGFLVVKRLHRYYLNQHDALRLILPLTDKSVIRSSFL